MTRHLAALGMELAAAVLLAACGGSATQPAESGTTPDGQVALVESVATPEESAASALIGESMAPEVGPVTSASAPDLTPAEIGELRAAAEEAYERFDSITLPPFQPGRKLSRETRAYMAKRQGQAKSAEWESTLRFLSPAERRDAIGSAHFQCWAETKFVPWMEQRAVALDAATKAIQALFEAGPPSSKVAAAAQIGSMHASMVDTLASAPLDPSIEGDQELLRIYRDAVEDRARPHRQHAVAAFSLCRAVAAEHGIDSTFSRICATELTRLGH